MLPLAEETGDAQMQDVPRADEQMVKAGVRPSLEFVKAMGRRRPSGSAALARRDGLLAAGATRQGMGAADRLRAPTTWRPLPQSLSGRRAQGCAWGTP